MSGVPDLDSKHDPWCSRTGLSRGNPPQKRTEGVEGFPCSLKKQLPNRVASNTHPPSGVFFSAPYRRGARGGIEPIELEAPVRLDANAPPDPREKLAAMRKGAGVRLRLWFRFARFARFAPRSREGFPAGGFGDAAKEPT